MGSMTEFLGIFDGINGIDGISEGKAEEFWTGLTRFTRLGKAMGGLGDVL
jgi:hypothetical protein